MTNIIEGAINLNPEKDTIFLSNTIPTVITASITKNAPKIAKNLIP